MSRFRPPFHWTCSRALRINFFAGNVPPTPQGVAGLTQRRFRVSTRFRVCGELAECGFRFLLTRPPPVRRRRSGGFAMKLFITEFSRGLSFTSAVGRSTISFLGNTKSRGGHSTPRCGGFLAGAAGRRP